VVGRDLGLYAEEEIAEVHASEMRLLKQTQANERRAGLTPKVVTTEYTGLMGQFFDPNQEVFPQYDPVIDPSVGIPLTREQEKAHTAVRRLIEEAKEKAQPQNELPNPDPAEEGGGNGVVGGEDPPVEEPTPEPEPPPEEPTPEPVEQPPLPESPPTPEPEPTPISP
jgi:hypothetical protein